MYVSSMRHCKIKKNAVQREDTYLPAMKLYSSILSNGSIVTLCFMSGPWARKIACK